MRLSSYCILLIIVHAIIAAQPRGRMQKVTTNIKNVTAVLPITGGPNGQTAEGYILRSPDSLFFCDEDFAVLKARPTGNGSIYPSMHNRYIYIRDRFNNPEASYDNYMVGKDLNSTISRQLLIDSDGVEHYSFEQPCYECWGPAATVVSDKTGRFYHLHGEHLTLYIYDSSGNLLQKISYAKRNERYSRRDSRMSILGDGENIAILASKMTRSDKPTAGPELKSDGGWPPMPTSAFVSLFILDKNGTVLIEQAVPGYKALNITTSGNEKYILATTTRSRIDHAPTTYVYNSNTTLLFRHFGEPKCIAIHDNLIIFGKEGAVIGVDGQNGAELWRIDTNGHEVQAITSISSSGMNLFGAYVKRTLKGEERYRDNDLFIFDESGKQHQILPLGKGEQSGVWQGGYSFIAQGSVSAFGGSIWRFIQE
ncbi:hypothetical protein ACFL6E_00785 [Candidatus Neomarinimicrobiota bacterium]